MSSVPRLPIDTIGDDHASDTPYSSGYSDFFDGRSAGFRTVDWRWFDDKHAAD
jgi:hypothetical protein